MDTKSFLELYDIFHSKKVEADVEQLRHIQLLEELEYVSLRNSIFNDYEAQDEDDEKYLFIDYNLIHKKILSHSGVTSFIKITNQPAYIVQPKCMSEEEKLMLLQEDLMP